MIKTVYDIKFIFGMCHHSWAAETHGKCEHDWNYLNYTFAKSTFSVTDNLANGALITPTQTCLYACAITKLSITISCDRCATRHPWVRFGTSPLTTNTNTTNLYPTTVPEIKLYDYVMIWMRFPQCKHGMLSRTSTFRDRSNTCATETSLRFLEITLPLKQKEN